MINITKCIHSDLWHLRQIIHEVEDRGGKVRFGDVHYRHFVLKEMRVNAKHRPSYEGLSDHYAVVCPRQNTRTIR